MTAFSRAHWRPALGLGLLFTGAALAPSACISGYVFDLTGGSGTASTGSTNPASTSSGLGGGTTSTSTTMGPGTGGMTASTSGTPSSTSTVSTTSSSGMPCTERDCSNAACANSFACVPAAPSGWTGFFSLYDGAASKDPGCGGEFPSSMYTGNNMISVPPAVCNCTCNPPTGEKCEIAGPLDGRAQVQTMFGPGALDAIFSADAPCNGGGNCQGDLFETAAWTGTCQGANYYAAGVTTCGAGSDCTNGTAACNQSVQVGPLQVASGSCTANAQPPTIPPVNWGTVGEACGGAMPGTGCSGTETCLPLPGGPFQSGICIMQTGQQSCPPGVFSQQHLFYGGSSDTRSCSACTCGASAGATCSATITVYLNTGGGLCSGQNVVLKPDTQNGDCVNTPSNPNVGDRKAVFTAPTGGACPSDAQPMGSATPSMPTTFCCVP